MGISDWLRKISGDNQGPGPGSVTAETVEPKFTVEMSFTGPEAVGLVKLSGTTTFGRDAVEALLVRHDASARGMLMLDGVLQREPENPVDPQAVAVHVEGEKIGYLPGFVAAVVPLSNSGAIEVPLQLFYIRPDGKPSRAEAWGWLGGGEPQWAYSEGAPPPLTSAEKNLAHHELTSNMVESAIKGGGERARQFEEGVVDGIHYLQAVEPIKELKRQGRWEDALRLCYIAIDGAEAAREGREPAPWYTEQAAIVLRKLGRRDDEIDILERWLEACPADRREGSTIAERLRVLRGQKP